MRVKRCVSGLWPHAVSLASASLDFTHTELAVLKGLPHSGIIRLAGFQAPQMVPAPHHTVNPYEHELTAGAIITVDPERIRIRPA